MRVYRVERDDGNGPYRVLSKWGTFTSFKDAIHPNGFDDERHPTCAWVEMDVIQQGCPWIFGFRTMVDLRSWFNAAERARLAHFGFKVSHYYVPNPRRWVDLDDGQLVFHRKVAILVKRVDLKWPKHTTSKSLALISDLGEGSSSQPAESAATSASQLTLSLD